MILTKAQKQVLTVAARDRTIIIGGIDASPGVKLFMALRLARLGLLQYRAPNSLIEHSQWELTDAGRQAIGLPAREPQP